MNYQDIYLICFIEMRNDMWDFEKYGKNISVILERDIKYTYNDINELQQEMASYLDARTLIFMLVENSIGSLIGYIACIKNKVVPLMLDVNISQEKFNYIYNIYRPKYIWLPELSQIKKLGTVVYSKFGYVLLKSEYLWKDLYSELALLMCTSGSTGSNKLVRISYKNILENTKSIISALDIKENDKALCVLPMHYAYGLSVINTHLFCGATILLSNRKIYDKRIWEYFKKFHGNSISGVAYTYKILKKLGFEKWELPDLEVITQAGEKMSEELYSYLTEYACKNGVRFYPMYGQTEATARMTCMEWNKNRDKFGSVGKSISGGKINILDSENNYISMPKKVGQIVYEGENVALGYCENVEDLSKGNEWRNILFTGDMGFIDEDGYLYVIGRNDKYIKLAGNRINIQEIQNILERKFKECIFDVKFDKKKVFVLYEGEISNEEVLDYISKYMGFSKNIYKIIKIKEIPILASGKIDNRKIKSLMLDEKEI